jgi:hypothetical protein
VKGVGVGRGVSAATRPSGVEVVAVGDIEIRVEVRKGVRLSVSGVEGNGPETQAVRRRQREVRGKTRTIGLSMERLGCRDILESMSYFMNFHH